MTLEFTLHDYLSSSGMHQERVLAAPLAVQQMAEDFLRRLNLLMSSFYGAMPVGSPARKFTSGYRTHAANVAAGGAPNSFHERGGAGDVEDDDGHLAIFCLADIANACAAKSGTSLLQHIGLWIENPMHTRKRRSDGTWARWVHFQCRPPKSGKIVFDPGTTLPR